MKKISIYKFILAALSLLSVSSAGVYFSYRLNNAGIIIAVIIALSSLLILYRKNLLTENGQDILDAPPDQDGRKNRLLKITALIIYLSSTAASLAFLAAARTDEALVTPWSVVHPAFFACYALAVSFLYLIFAARLFAPESRMGLGLLVLQSALAFSVLPVVYKIGYGFDPFVHRATIKLILEQGAVYPKPFYYLGYYGLSVIANKMLFIPLAAFDKLLMPVLSSLLLSASLFRFWRKDSDRRHGLIAALGLLLFPVLIFAFTTPQHLGYLFLILAILEIANTEDRHGLVFPLLLALASLAFHPLAGIPACLYLISAYLRIKGVRARVQAAWILPSALILPALLAASQGSLPESLDFSAVTGIFSAKHPSFPDSPDALLNAVYLVAGNAWLAWLALAAIGAAILKREKPGSQTAILFSLSMLLSSAIAAVLGFHGLIDYERLDFALRIRLMALLFLLPLVLSGLQSAVKKISAISKKQALVAILMVSLSSSAALYLSYPRKDALYNSRGSSIGRTDIDTVRMIHDRAKGDYIVLANQQVSAAALNEYGFLKYFYPPSCPEETCGGIFYYPLPTGGPLYDRYLDMVYKEPSRENALKAMELAGADEAYFVLNSYWWAFPKIRDEALLEADSHEKLGGGSVYIFRYKK